MSGTFGWLQVDLIGEKLAEAYPQRDPFGVRFTELRQMVERLEGFRAEDGHPVNERILETIQARWHEEREELGGDED